MRRIVWFSCGAASAVAAKLVTRDYPDSHVVYCNTMVSEHRDNHRFLADVARWIDREITIISSPKYLSIDEVFERTRYMAGIAGARCTVEMKKLPREAFQQPNDIHIFGYTEDEKKRAETFETNNPSLQVYWPLIDHGVSKADCLYRLEAAGIKLPAMYGLGFDHNNCIGCVKATSPGYWNRTRKLFPETFERRAKQSRALGVRLARVKGARVFLDELPPDAIEPDDQIDCGPACQQPEQKP